jgi:hypothetical protein
MPQKIKKSPAPKLGIVKDWPDRVAAEHETIERFKHSAGLLGLSMEEVDPTGKTKDGIEPDFIFSLHFEHGKTWRQPSIHLLWNPIEFLAERGFAKSILNACSHTFLASGGSRYNDNRINQYRGILRNRILSSVSPSLDAPIVQPKNIQNRRIFYAGVNWERIKGETRYNTLLSALDTTGVLDLYGPKEMFGVEVWKGFKSYKGELPFDGSSLLHSAASSGIYLCLSSEKHIEYELLSNRIFEASASGCLIIANYHEAAHEMFGDSILWLDGNSESEMFKQICHFRDWANKNPKDAIGLAKRSQNIFKKSLLLSKQIFKTIEEASSENSAYLTEFSRFEKSLATSKDGFQQKGWIPLARQDRELIPHAVGKLLISLRDLDESIELVTSPWIACSPDSAVRLMPHFEKSCPFCKIDIQNANTFVRNRRVLLSIDPMRYEKTYSSEPFLYHECSNWLNRNGKLAAYDSDLKSMGLLIRSKNLIIPMDVYGTDVNSWHSNAKSVKRKLRLRISKKSRLYRALGRWSQKLDRDSWVRLSLVWIYIKYFSIPEEL